MSTTPKMESKMNTAISNQDIIIFKISSRHHYIFNCRQTIGSTPKYYLISQSKKKRKNQLRFGDSKVQYFEGSVTMRKGDLRVSECQWFLLVVLPLRSQKSFEICIFGELPIFCLQLNIL